jgi:hypothetical protein
LHNNNKFKDIKGLSKSAIEFSFVVSVLKVGYTDILIRFVTEVDEPSRDKMLRLFHIIARSTVSFAEIPIC